MIDHYLKPRIYGRDRRGEPLPVPADAAGEGPMSTCANPSYRERVGYQAGLLGGFALVAAALLVMGDIATRDAIAQRQAEDLLASLSQVIPPELHDNDLLADDLTLTGADGEPITVYRALEGLDVTGGRLRGDRQGYAGPIACCSASTRWPRARRPGAGPYRDAGPRRQDRGRPRRLDPGLRRPLPGRPAAERWAVKKDGGVFDQFSGATITPRAVVRAIKGGLELFAAHRDALTASAVLTEHRDPDGG
jgi:electron transport complex protein RnfG